MKTGHCLKTLCSYKISKSKFYKISSNDVIPVSSFAQPFMPLINLGKMDVKMVVMMMC